jgi:hypothetical protein
MWVLVHPRPAAPWAIQPSQKRNFGDSGGECWFTQSNLRCIRNEKSVKSVMQGKVEKQCWVRSPGTAALFIATDAQMPAMWPNADHLTLLLFLPSSYWSPSHSLIVVVFLFTLQSESTHSSLSQKFNYKVPYLVCKRWLFL